MKLATHSDVFSKKFISIDSVREKASSCFTSTSLHKGTSKYMFIYTPDVLTDLALIGWLPVDAYQVSPKKEENVGFQKHFIKLRNEKYFIGTKDNIEMIPELLLINSYDAKCSFKFYVTLYRVASESAIVMKSDRLLNESGEEKMKLSHKGEKLTEYFDDLVKSFDENVATAIELMNEMSSMELTDKQQKTFAQLCCRARWDYRYELQNTNSILDPWREEDEKSDLLTVSYKLQEKLIKGGWVGAGGRAIKPIKDPNRELGINHKLFTIIEDYYQDLAKLKKN